MALNCVVKCIQKPSRVPGCAHDAPRVRRMALSDSAAPLIERAAGASRTKTASATDSTTPSEAAIR